MLLDALRIRINSVVERHLAGYPERIKQSRLDDKIIRDPIFGFQRFHPHETLVIDSPLFQRLRGIFQTSLAYLTYPSAIHTRFEHSLNCVRLATQMLDALQRRGVNVDARDYLEVRLAALLHDVGHCVFSHGSESYYQELEELTQTLVDEELSSGDAAPGEVVNYCIITCEAFRKLLWEPTVDACADLAEIEGDLRRVSLKRVAQMIIASAPDDNAQERFLTDIVNGPMDVDKLDYLTRDSYFTGIGLSVDIDRLVHSVRVATVPNPSRNRSERRLVVDHKGIAVVEQMLFARMLLYDTVYNHHKVRAAGQDLLRIFREHAQDKSWPTTSGTLGSISDLLEMDEYHFFGSEFPAGPLRDRIERLKARDVSVRALVLTPRGVVDGDSHETLSSYWSFAQNRKEPSARVLAANFFDKIIIPATVAYARQVGATDITSGDVSIDIPVPPRLTKLGVETFILLAHARGKGEQVVALDQLFPFHKVTNNYSKQYKYRSYVFTQERWSKEVAYGAFRAFQDNGIQLNDLGLILAHQTDRGQAYDLVLRETGKEPPSWLQAYYVPDEEDSGIELGAGECSSCGLDRQPSWNFCPGCGSVVVQT